MFFKRPKTANNFFLYERLAFLRLMDYIDSPVEQEIDKFIDREEEIWKEAWLAYLDDPLNFWTVVVVLEKIMGKKSQFFHFPLSDFWDPIKSPRLFERFDKSIYSDVHGSDYSLANEASFQYTAFRVAEACGLFLAFDIHKIFFTSYLEEVREYEFQKMLDLARSNQAYWNDEDMGVFLTKMNYLLSDYGDRSIYWNGEGYENLLDSDDPSDDFNSILHLLWDSLSITLEVDAENASKIHRYVVDQISFDCSFHRDLYTAKLLKLLPSFEKVGNLLRIPAEIILTADFPLIQFLWYLSLDDIVYVFNWKIDEYLDVSVSFEWTLLKAMGFDVEGKKTAKPKLSYNERTESLEIDWRKLALWEANEVFMREYFDLMFDADTGVSIDEIVERLEPNIDSFSKTDVAKAKKRLGYDRVWLINKRIEKAAGMPEFFRIEDGHIRLSKPVRIEKATKTLEK